MGYVPTVDDTLHTTR